MNINDFFGAGKRLLIHWSKRQKIADGVFAARAMADQAPSPPKARSKKSKKYLFYFNELIGKFAKNHSW